MMQTSPLPSSTPPRPPRADRGPARHLAALVCLPSLVRPSCVVLGVRVRALWAGGSGILLRCRRDAGGPFGGRHARRFIGGESDYVITSMSVR